VVGQEETVVMRGPLIAALLAATLAACGAPAKAPEFNQAPPPPADVTTTTTTAPATCDAAAAGFAMGQAYSESLAEDVRRRTGARTVRSLRPGQAVTLEYNAERINLDLDLAGRVTRARCG
jgi:hypothetical protein